MKVHIAATPRTTAATGHGAHELAWSYLLDAVFADAYHAGVADLHLSLPDAALLEEVRIRAELTPQVEAARGVAYAFLDNSRTVPAGTDRLYLLATGMRRPRPARSGGARWREVFGLCVYTPRARLWGVAIRWASLRGRPDLVDRATFAMRRDFVATRSPLARYRLSAWSRS